MRPRQYDLAGLPLRYFNAGELEALLHLYELVQARVVVEFGVNTGRNPLAAFRNIRTIERYVGVDVMPGYVPKMRVQRREVPAAAGELAQHDPRFHLILSPRGTFDLSEKDLPECDAVFIDGDHSREAVLHDYDLATKIVRRGGIIIFHDDNGSPAVEVTPALNELVARGVPIQHVAGTWLSFERR